MRDVSNYWTIVNINLEGCGIKQSRFNFKTQFRQLLRENEGSNEKPSYNRQQSEGRGSM
jgi:hypothetical protein